MNTPCPCIEFEERAAIMEHDGGLPRLQAEHEAAEIMCDRCPNNPNQETDDETPTPDRQKRKDDQ